MRAILAGNFLPVQAKDCFEQFTDLGPGEAKDYGMKICRT